MRRAILLVLLVVPVLTRCECEEKSRAAVGAVVVEPVEIDFGVICLNDTAVGEVQIANEGLGDLHITRVSVAQSAGGYTVGQVPGTLAPSEIVKIPVTLTVSSAGADYNGTVIVETDDPANPKRTVNLAATAFGGKRREVDVRCINAVSGVDGRCTFLQFGDVRNGTNLERTARIKNNGCGPLQVYEVRPEADVSGGGDPADEALFTVVGPQPQPLALAGLSEVEVRVRFSPPAGTEERTPNIQLHVRTDDPDVGDVAVGLFARGVVPNIQVDPHVLTFFGADAQTEKEVQVTNSGGAAVAVGISLAAGSSEKWVVDYDSGAFAALLGTQPVRVHLDVDSGWQGNAQGTLVIAPAGEPEERVELYGGAFPQIAVDPNPVDFGQVPVGAGRSCCLADPERDLTVEIVNLGDASLRVDAISDVNDNPGDSFIVSAGGLPVTLAKDQRHPFTVTFRDNPMITDDLAVLAVYSNDPQYAGSFFAVALTSQNDANFPPTPQIAVSPNSPSAWLVGAALTFDGTQTSDPENDAIVEYRWTLSAPANSAVALAGSSPAQRTLTPDVAGTYKVSLAATDKYDPRPGTTTRPVSVSVVVK